MEHLEIYAKKQGLDKVFDDLNLNILVGPIESEMSSFAAATGSVNSRSLFNSNLT
jgi:hypothetical protein